MLVQDCNLVLYNKNGMMPPDAIFATGTYNKGAAPCKLTVSSAGAGFIAVSDSHSAQLYTAPAPKEVGSTCLASQQQRLHVSWHL